MHDLLTYNTKDNKFYIFYNTLESAFPSSAHLCLETSHVLKKSHNMFPGLSSNSFRSTIPNTLPDFYDFKSNIKTSPAWLRSGDINSDGFPDIVGSYQTRKGGNLLPFILINTGCKIISEKKSEVLSSIKELANDEKDLPQCNGTHSNGVLINYELIYSEEHYNGVLKNYKNAQQVSFFDLDENGILDLFLIRYNETVKWNQIITLVNTYHKDFFLKTKIINLSNTK